MPQDGQRRIGGRYLLSGSSAAAPWAPSGPGTTRSCSRRVAVKELKRPDRASPTRRPSTCASGSCARRGPLGGLSHPNVITVFDVVDADGEPVVVMELVPVAQPRRDDRRARRPVRRAGGGRRVRHGGRVCAPRTAPASRTVTSSRATSSSRDDGRDQAHRLRHRPQHRRRPDDERRPRARLARLHRAGGRRRPARDARRRPVGARRHAVRRGRGPPALRRRRRPGAHHHRGRRRRRAAAAPVGPVSDVIAGADGEGARRRGCRWTRCASGCGRSSPTPTTRSTPAPRTPRRSPHRHAPARPPRRPPSTRSPHAARSRWRPGRPSPPALLAADPGPLPGPPPGRSGAMRQDVPMPLRPERRCGPTPCAPTAAPSTRPDRARSPRRRPGRSRSRPRRCSPWRSSSPARWWCCSAPAAGWAVTRVIGGPVAVRHGHGDLGRHRADLAPRPAGLRRPASPPAGRSSTTSAGRRLAHRVRSSARTAPRSSRSSGRSRATPRSPGSRPTGSASTPLERSELADDRLTVPHRPRRPAARHLAARSCPADGDAVWVVPLTVPGERGRGHRARPCSSVLMAGFATDRGLIARVP